MMIRGMPMPSPTPSPTFAVESFAGEVAASVVPFVFATLITAALVDAALLLVEDDGGD